MEALGRLAGAAQGGEDGASPRWGRPRGRRIRASARCSCWGMAAAVAAWRGTKREWHKQLRRSTPACSQGGTSNGGAKAKPAGKGWVGSGKGGVEGLCCGRGRGWMQSAGCEHGGGVGGWVGGGLRLTVGGWLAAYRRFACGLCSCCCPCPAGERRGASD